MKNALQLGTSIGGEEFTLPLDLVTRTLAIIAIRGAGKTVAATVLAEEMCEAGLPWVALDPVGVWWGVRANPDGTPGGYPVVILGGEHADLSITKDSGRRVADAILEENVSCVVDLSGESKNTWRHFTGDFCDRLMELRPSVPRHIFIEEAPEFVPQRPLGEQKRSLAAVDRLIRLGRNRGYGATLISQRFATIQKDVLTQCENLLAMRSVGKPDRNAVRDWIAECVETEHHQHPQADSFLDSLTGLPDGEGWFWSPQWLNIFSRIKVRRRKTYHPGETRSVGQHAKQVQLSDVHEFVGRFQQRLEAEQSPAPKPDSRKMIPDSTALPRNWPDYEKVAASLGEENARLRGQVADLHRELSQTRAALEGIRRQLEPHYRSLQKLFGDLESVTTPAASNGIDGSVFEPWKQKLGSGAAKVIDVLIGRGGELTRRQLQTLSAYSERNLRNIVSQLNTNGLIEKDGDKVRLRVP